MNPSFQQPEPKDLQPQDNLSQQMQTLRIQDTTDEKVDSLDQQPKAPLEKASQSNDVDFYRIMSGKEQRTTIMIRNIPNKFKQINLLEMINELHSQQFDYFYLPMDLKVIPAYLLTPLDPVQCRLRLRELHRSHLHPGLLPGLPEHRVVPLHL
jgi:hypothetical protein